ncbi:MAG: hypothetical protein IJA10_10880 [Lachnospiraceae bacterium]|nr:hypothetical protein [Lachnospiraceae bacterium]
MREINKNYILKEIVDQYNELTKNGKLIEQNEKLILPSLTSLNIAFHIVEKFLKPYRDEDIIWDNHWTDRLNNLYMIGISFKGNDNFCVIAVAKKNCDTEKKLWVFQRYLRDNSYTYGIFVQEYRWCLLKDKDIIVELDFNDDVNVDIFSKFLCWDN